MAMEAEEFTVPSFLESSDEDTIHEKMLDNLPDDIDKTEGGFAWDFTRPVAIALSEFVEGALIETLQSFFPSTCEESYLLDLHGETRGLYRREAVSASGTIQVSAPSGTVIPLNYGFSTEADSDGTTVDFYTTEEATVDDTEIVLIPIEATEGGASGNVAADSIVLQSGDEDGNILDAITGVTNPSATSGGLDEEEDDDFRERIVTFDQSKDVSYVGSSADYQRWALSVSGVGSVTVLKSDDEVGTVTLVVYDTDGNPASEELRTAVYDYIVSPDSPEDRLAPLCVNLIISSLLSEMIDISATVYLSGITLEQCKTSFSELVNDYLATCITDNVVRLSGIYSCLSNIDGVYDYSDVTICISGGTPGTSNLTVTEGYIPVIGPLTLTEGE